MLAFNDDDLKAVRMKSNANVQLMDAHEKSTKNSPFKAEFSQRSEQKW